MAEVKNPCFALELAAQIVSSPELAADLRTLAQEYLCTRCGNRPAADKHLLCADCRRYQTDWAIGRYWMRVANKQCTQCGTPVTKFRKCPKCRRRAAARYTPKPRTRKPKAAKPKVAKRVRITIPQPKTRKERKERNLATKEI